MCKILGVSRSGYQNWRKIPSPNAVQKFNLIRTIEKIFIGQRIRDLKYSDKIKAIVLALEEKGELGIIFN